MKKLYALFAVLALASCALEVPTNDMPVIDPTEETTDGTLNITIPGGFSLSGSTRVVEENEPLDLHLLRFTAGALADIREINVATDIEAVVGSDNQYTVAGLKIPAGEHHFVLLANIEGLDVLDAVTVGQTYEAVKALFEVEIEGAITDGAVPMWGEAEAEIVANSNPSLNIAITRALARIDVGVGNYNKTTNTWPGLTNFVMTSVTVVGPNNMYSIIPELDEEGNALEPSVPATATPFAIGPLFTYSGSVITEVVYVPEAEISSVTDRGQRMALVIGGKFDADGAGAGAADTVPTYYRAEFVDKDDVLRDVVRNHLYLFSISSVLARGAVDIEAAYNSASSDMTVTVVGWTTVDMPQDLR